MMEHLNEEVNLRKFNHWGSIIVIAFMFLAVPVTVLSVLNVRSPEPKAASQCVTNCGDPQYFCDTWQGGFCDDYRDIYCPVFCDFPGTNDRKVRVNAYGSTQIDGKPSMLDGFVNRKNFFGNDQEHFHTAMEDETFGVALLRNTQPFDFANREGRIHMDVDLKVSGRRYIRVMLSPQVTKGVVDDRSGRAVPTKALDIWFVNGGISVQNYKSANDSIYEGASVAGHDWPPYIGKENVRDKVDIYVKRNNIRVSINGNQQFSQAIPDIGFDRAYVYLVQASYNPCKDGECSLEEQVFHWDNFAFDGPKLAENSLTPAGSRDIVYNARGALNCTVKGTAATRLANHSWGTWLPWTVRLPDDGTPVSTNDISCNFEGGVASTPGDYQFFEVVKAGTGVTNPPPPPVAPPPPPPPPPPVAPPPPPPPAGTSNRITWQGKNWYLQGANLAWYNWPCDFGCNNNGGVLQNKTIISNKLAQAKDSGANVIRWWTFPGDPWQINRDASGPTGLNPSIYADFDAALDLANQHDLYYNFTLFSAPTALPQGWLTDATQRAKLANVLAPLFARYKDNPRVMTWEIINEPEWDIWSNKIAQAPVQATVKAISDAVNANSPALVTIGSAHLDGLSMWFGQGLDYYSPHWYDYMSSGGWCARCTDYNALKTRWPQLDKPVVIGEYYGATQVDSLARLNDWYNKGFAGSWPWTLFAEKTTDPGLTIDLNAMRTFTAQISDEGPKASADTTAPAVNITSHTTGQTVAGQVTLTAAATDNTGGSGVSKVEFFVNNASTPSGSDTSSPYQFVWNTSALTNGSYPITAKATDNAGNSAVKTVSLSVLNPTITCDSSFPVNKFHVCFFEGTNPGSGSLLGQRDEGISTSPTTVVFNPVNHNYNQSGEFGRTDQFSGIWRGSFNFPAGTYRFKVTSDDGVRLDVGNNGSLEIDKFFDQSPSTHQSGEVTLSGLTAIKLDWYENLGGATISLSWENIDKTPPAVPSGLTAKAVSTSQVDLNWNSSTENDIAGYWIVRDGITIGNSVLNKFSDPTAGPSKTYRYQVIAFDKANNNSAASGAVTVSTPALSDTTKPSKPLNLSVAVVSSSQINLNWGSSTDNVGVIAYEIYRGNNLIQKITAASFGDSTVLPGNQYCYYVVAVDQAGNKSEPSETKCDSTPGLPSVLPAPWLTADIGNVGQAGSVNYVNGVYTVRGSGADIWNKSDSFRYVYQDLNGNGSLVARVVNQTKTDSWAKAGLMIRESTAANSKYTFVAVAPDGGLFGQRRSSTGRNAGPNGYGSSYNLPVWLKLERVGNTYNLYRSTDGKIFTKVRSFRFTMPANVKIGLAVTAHNNSAISSAIFDNVQIIKN